MYRIKTKYLTENGRKQTITSYAKTEREKERIMEDHYDFIEYTEGAIIEQKVEKGYFASRKEIYKYKV